MHARCDRQLHTGIDARKKMNLPMNSCGDWPTSAAARGCPAPRSFAAPSPTTSMRGTCATATTFSASGETATWMVCSTSAAAGANGRDVREQSKTPGAYLKAEADPGCTKMSLTRLGGEGQVLQSFSPPQGRFGLAPTAAPQGSAASSRLPAVAASVRRLRNATRGAAHSLRRTAPGGPVGNHAGDDDHGAAFRRPPRRRVSAGAHPRMASSERPSARASSSRNPAK